MKREQVQAVVENIGKKAAQRRKRNAEAIKKSLEAVAAACGKYRGESGAEQFLADLLAAGQRVRKQVAESHKRGLCYDAVHGLAGELALFQGVFDEAA
jgi:hypothetical protein